MHFKHFFRGSAFFIGYFMNEFNKKMKNATVGIAGAGGLGSTVAAALTRTGIGKIIIADFDKIQTSNLNRQQYFANQIGQYKIDALIENLKLIDPNINITGHNIKLTKDNIPEIFNACDYLAECLDLADQKQMFIETVLSKIPKIPVIAASGLAGFGKSNDIKTQRITERLILCGDNKSGTDKNLQMTAPRVWIAAAHQANAIIELIMKSETIL